MRDDTIYALSTPAGIGAVAVIRVSGPAADTALDALTRAAPPVPRMASLRWLHDADGTRLDQALILRFVAPASFTGEDLVEFHCHGGRAVVASVLAALATVPGLRLARAGEFTWRAWHHGRLDLTEVEALGDLVQADTETQRRQAISGVSGALRARADAWRTALIDALAMIEATIDWSDEEVPERVDDAVRAIIAPMAAEAGTLLQGAQAAERIRGGFEVVLLGPPNAGKSTLINALAGREVAITAAEPGTTRDTLEVALDLSGLAVTVVDTAGLRRVDGGIEGIGIARAETRARDADLRIFLHAPDLTMPPEAAALARPGDLHVASKADLATCHEEARGTELAVSARTGDGLDGLIDAITERLGDLAAGAGPVGHARQREAIASMAQALAGAEGEIGGDAPELAAEQLRIALAAIEDLAGRAVVDDVLDAVFTRFCLGK